MPDFYNQMFFNKVESKVVNLFTMLNFFETRVYFLFVHTCPAKNR
jgi:hypothetical protein